MLHHEDQVGEELIDLEIDSTEQDLLVTEPTDTDDIVSAIEEPTEDNAITESEELTTAELPIDNTPAEPTVRSEEEKLIFGNIASTNFFAIEGSLLDRRSAENAKAKQLPPLQEEESIFTVEEHTFTEEQVSKYDDDTLPYSFLWWLHKTRKEHANTYQPYAGKRTGNPVVKTEELNHQIIENIFHSQSPAPIASSTRQLEQPFSRLSLKDREGDIIEKFIKDEPQIKPPSPDKLDVENKARRSAEDPNDLVSETLAVIYTEQMLFNKAIDTYKKLIFKYPEKSTYFADQIIKLEKKLN
jgi:hypothetical protein